MITEANRPEQRAAPEKREGDIEQNIGQILRGVCNHKPSVRIDPEITHNWRVACVRTQRGELVSV